MRLGIRRATPDRRGEPTLKDLIGMLQAPSLAASAGGWSAPSGGQAWSRRARRAAAFAIAAAVVAAGTPSAIREREAQLRNVDHAAGPAIDASAFLDTLGVNTHLSWTGTPYADPGRVADQLNYLGIRNLRDDFALNARSYQVVGDMMARGFRFDLVSGGDIKTFLGAVRDLQLAHPAGMIAIEGPNEVDNWPVKYDGQTGVQAAARYQHDLFKAAKAEPALAKVPVYNLTFAAVTASRRLGDLSPYADYANVHLYYGAGQPAYGWSPDDSVYHWSSWLDSGRLAAKGRPIVITETGATATPAWGGGVDEATQARQILNSLMDAASTGVAALYVYELVDGMNNGPNDEKSHYGLFRWDGSPRPAAAAVRNLISILRGGSTAGSAGATGALDYAIAGVPKWGGHLLFQRADGTKAIVVWAEPDIWDERKRTPIAPPNIAITIKLAAAAKVAIYDPLQDAHAMRSLGTTAQVGLDLTDHPVIVEIGDATR
jgi:hypothetical protein